MTQSKISTPTMAEEKRRAILVAQNIGANNALFLILGIYLTVTTGAWQAIGVILLALEAMIGGFVAASMFKGGQAKQATWVLLITNCTAPALAAWIVASFSWVSVAYIAVSTYFIYSYATSPEQKRPILTTIVLALVVSAVSWFAQGPWMLVSPAMLTIAPIFVTILGIIFIVIVTRQVLQGNIRSRLIAWFAIVGLVPLTLIAAMSYYLSYQTITRQTEEQLNSIAEDKAQQIEQYAAERQKGVAIFARQPVTINALNSFTSAFIIGGVDSEQYNLLNDEYRSYLADFAQGYGYDDLFLISKGGLIVFSTTSGEDLGSNLYSGIYKNTELAKVYVQSQTLLEVNFSDFTYYPPTNEPAAFIAAPVMKDDELIGAVALQVNNKDLYAAVNDFTGLGSTGEIQIGSKVGDKILFVIPLRNDPYAAFRISTLIGSNTGLAIQQAIQGLSGGAITTDYRGQEVLASWRYLPGLRWAMVVKIDTEEAFAPITALRNAALLMGGLSLLAVIIAAFLVANSIARPIINLTKVAQIVSGGDINAQAKVETNDEVGILAGTFNAMTAQLRDLISSLEQRVTARTKDLETVAEVGTATATILESRKLLQEVVDLTKDRFSLYHSHIYLMDEKGENLVLTAGAGEPGRVMVAEGRSIPLAREQSLVARAARERKGVTVNDVTQAPDFLPNPLLPDTRSELAVPMIVGGNVLGVFDIQSEQVGRFTDTDVNIQTTLAAQLATSIQNVRSFERSKKEAELQSLVNLIGSRIQRTTSIEETLQTAIRELGTAIGASRVKAKLHPASEAVSTETTSAD